MSVYHVLIPDFYPGNITLKCVDQVINILFLLLRNGKQEEAQTDEARFEVHRKYDVVLEMHLGDEEPSLLLYRTMVQGPSIRSVAYHHL